MRSAFADPRTITIDYTLTNDDGAVDVQVQYSTDGGASFADCTEAAGAGSEGRTALSASPTGTPHRFVWNAQVDLGGGIADVVIRVVPIEDGAAALLETTQVFEAGNTKVAAQVQPPGSVEGNVIVAFTLQDASGDGASAIIQVSEGGAPFATLPTSTAGLLAVLADDPPGTRAALGVAAIVATPETNLATTPAGVSHIAIWASETAPPAGIGARRVDSVRLRITPFDSEVGVAATTAPFVADNNSNPAVAIYNPGFPLDSSFEIPINYTVRDEESNPADVVVQYALGTDAFVALPASAAEIRQVLDGTHPTLTRAALRFATQASRFVEAPLQYGAGDPTTQVRSDAFVREGLSFMQGGLPFVLGKEIEVFQGPPTATAPLGKRTVVAFDAATGTVTLGAPLAFAPVLTVPGTFFRLNAIDPTRSLATSPGGVDRVFIWDSAADVTDPAIVDVRVRLVALDSEVGVEAATGTTLGTGSPLASANVGTGGLGSRAIATFRNGSALRVAVLNETTADLSVFDVNATNDLVFRESVSLDFANPSHVATGDLDGDGRDDVAVTYADSDFVSLFVQAASGTLTAHPQTLLPTGAIVLQQPPPTSTAAILVYRDLSRRAVAIGDVNDDLRPDLVVTNPLNDNVAVFLQRPDGQLGADGPSPRTPNSLLGAGDSPQDLAIADIDADGDNDLAILNLIGNEVTVYEQDATGALVLRPFAPTSRSQASLTYAPFPGRDALVLFGGERNTSFLSFLNDTRELVGTTWTANRAANAPYNRGRHSAVFDPGIGRVVLFGGRDMDGVRRNDSWSYDGSSWQRLSPTGTLPIVRDDHAGAYCDFRPPASAQFGVFYLGGRGAFTDGVTNQVVRLRTGSAWLQIFPDSPTVSFQPKRANHAAVFAPFPLPKGNRLVVFGGLNSAGQPLADLWEWTGNVVGTTWVQASPVGPSPTARSDHAMAFDSVRNVVVLFGGTTDQGRTPLGDTWTWDGTTWTPHTPAVSPPARYAHVMALDASRGVVVMFGGAFDLTQRNLRNDVWEWDGTTWTERPAPMLETGTDAVSLIAADLDPSDLDGRLDLIAASHTLSSVNRGGANLAIFRHAALPADPWSFTALPPVPAGLTPYGLAAGTLDGRFTIAVTNREGGTVSFFEPDGTAGLAHVRTADAGADPFAATFVDLGGDGLDDLLVANRDGNDLGVFVQGAGGGLGALLRDALTLRSGDFPVKAQVGDVTGDGRPDVVAVDSSGAGATLFRQEPSGTFAPGETLPAGESPFGMAIGDLNGDGRNDVAIANFDVSIDAIGGDGVPDATEITIYRQTAAGTLVRGAPLFLVRSPATATADVIRQSMDVAIGDVTGDGRSDLIVTDPAFARFLIYPQQPDGTLAASATAIITQGRCRTVQVADVNTDGRQDLVGITFFQLVAVSRLVVATQSDAGGFANVAAGNAGFARGFTGGAGTASYLVPTEQNGVTAGTPSPAGDNADPRGLALADLNGDGRTDAVVSNTGDGTVTVFLQTPDTVSPSAFLLIPQQILPAPPFSVAGAPVAVNAAPAVRGTAAFDVDRDGRADLVLTQSAADLVTVEPRVSGEAFYPTFRAQPGLPAAGAPIFIDARDVNGDGRADAAVTTTEANAVRILLQR